MRFTFSPIGTVTSKFGAMESIRKYPHTGIDFACPNGLPVHSLTDGVVSKITNESTSTLGNGLFIKTEHGYSFIYGHFSKLNVNGIGDKVSVGDVIGFCGSTGNSSGSHLHFGAMNKFGEYVNPQEALEHLQAILESLIG